MSDTQNHYYPEYIQAIKISNRYYSEFNNKYVVETPLSDYLYSEWYLQTSIVKPQVNTTINNFTQILDSINTIHNNWISGWKVKQCQSNATVLAEKNQQQRLYKAHEYINENCVGLLPNINDTITILSRFSSDKIQLGSWVIQTEQWNPNRGKVLRIYWNIDSDAAAILVEELTKNIPDNIQYCFKLPSNTMHFDRPDTAVLYIYARDSSLIIPAIKKTQQQINSYLYDETPKLTKKIATGVALAEEPTDKNHSFGTSRCSMIAKALQMAHEAYIKSEARIIEIIEKEFIQYDISIDKPYMLNKNKG